MQRITQNVPLEEGDGVEGSVLSAGGHVSVEHQFRRESFELLAVGHGGRHALLCPDIAPQPMEVGLPRARRDAECGWSDSVSFHFEEEAMTWPNHRFEPTIMSPQLPFSRQRLAVAHPGR